MPKKYSFDPDLFEKLFRKSLEYAKTAKKNKSIAKKWFLIAKNDIEITQLLYQNEFYAGATYHLQQAFEKLVKGYYILSGREDPNKTKSHYYNIERLKKEIRDEYVNTFLKLSESISQERIDLESAEKTLSFLKKTEDEIRLVKREELQKIFDLIKKLENILTDIKTVEKTEAKLQERRFIKGLRHLIFQITHFRIRDSQVREAVKKEQVIIYLKSASISIKLQLIALFTFLHFNSPRYPYDDKTKVTFFDYKEDLGIVQSIPELIVLFNEIYDSFELDEEEQNDLSLH